MVVCVAGALVLRRSWPDEPAAAARQTTVAGGARQTRRCSMRETATESMHHPPCHATLCSGRARMRRPAVGNVRRGAAQQRRRRMHTAMAHYEVSPTSPLRRRWRRRCRSKSSAACRSACSVSRAPNRNHAARRRTVVQRAGSKGSLALLHEVVEHRGLRGFPEKLCAGMQATAASRARDQRPRHRAQRARRRRGRTGRCVLRALDTKRSMSNCTAPAPSRCR